MFLLTIIKLLIKEKFFEKYFSNRVKWIFSFSIYKIIDNKYKIFGLDLKKDLKNKHINHNFKKINLTLNKNLKFLNKINFHYVLHAAAQQPSSSEINEYSFFRNNVNSTLNLIKNLKKDKLKKLFIVQVLAFMILKINQKILKKQIP